MTLEHIVEKRDSLIRASQYQHSPFDAMFVGAAAAHCTFIHVERPIERLIDSTTPSLPLDWCLSPEALVAPQGVLSYDFSPLRVLNMHMFSIAWAIRDMRLWVTGVPELPVPSELPGLAVDWPMLTRLDGAIQDVPESEQLLRVFVATMF